MAKCMFCGNQVTDTGYDGQWKCDRCGSYEDYAEAPTRGSGVDKWQRDNNRNTHFNNNRPYRNIGDDDLN